MKLRSALCSLLLATTAAAMPFKAPVVIDTVSSPRDWLVVEDLNRDARPDIMCAAPGSGLRWWRNDGGGVYTQQPDVPLSGGAPVCVLPRNIDRDADMDLIVLVDPGNTVGVIKIIENLGAAGFSQSAASIPLSGKLVPGSLPLAEDFDRDGDVDILQAHQDAAQSPGNDVLSLMLNDGIGNFGAPVTVTSALNWPTALAWHDCDENGVPDLLVGTTGTPQLRIYRNYKPGAFLVADLLTDPPVGISEVIGTSRGTVVIRYDGPGSGADSGLVSRLSLESLLDWKSNPVPASAKILTCTRKVSMTESGGLDLLLLTWNAQTQERELWWHPMGRNDQAINLGPTQARTLQWADMDHDGDGDIVMLRAGDIAIQLSESIRPDTILGADAMALTLSHPAVEKLVVADLLPASGDEIAGAITEEGSIRIFTFDNGALQPGTLVTSAASGISALRAADLDRDGDVDLVFNVPGDGRVQWLRNNGNGTFAAPATIFAKPDPGPLDTGDIDRDGDIDVVMTFADGSVIVAMNSGAATPAWNMESGGSTGTIALEVKIADTTPGQRQEILVQTFSFGSPASSLRIIRHLIFPSPGWQMATLASGNGSARGIAVADVEPDGDLDIVAGPGNTPGLYINNGAGIFAAPVMSGQADFTNTRGLQLLDLDRDGTLEVFAVTAAAKLLATSVTAAGFGSRVEVTADFTGQQLRDVAVLSRYQEHDYLVISDKSTPALRFVHNDLRQMQHSVQPIAATDTRGMRAPVFSVALTNPALPGGPEMQIYAIRFWNTRNGNALLMDHFTAMVEKVELYADAGVTGVFEPGVDTLLSSTNASLNGDGLLHVNMGGAQLAPLQTKRWIVAFKYQSAAVPGLNGFKTEWNGENPSDIVAAMSGPTGTAGVIGGRVPTVMRTISLVNLSPLQQWRVAHWGSPDNSGAAADTSDPDGDGNGNLVEYVTGTDPLAVTPAALSPYFDSLGRFAVTAAFAYPPQPDVSVSIESSFTLQPGSWTNFAARNGAGVWTGPALLTPGNISQGKQPIDFAAPLPQSSRLFFRLRVTAP